MSKILKALSYSAAIGSLATLTGCIVAPNSKQPYHNYNAVQNQSQNMNSSKTAGSTGGEWDRGCADAEAGSYDRSGNAGPDYEKGWQACNKHAKQQNANRGDKEWERGCADAKSGSYDRSGNAGPTYEQGWQACNSNKQSGNTSAGAVEAAKQICLEKMGNTAHIQTVSALKPGFWEIIMMDDSGRKVACTADTAAGNVADWVEM